MKGDKRRKHSVHYTEYYNIINFTKLMLFRILAINLWYSLVDNENYLKITLVNTNIPKTLN